MKAAAGSLCKRLLGIDGESWTYTVTLPLLGGPLTLEKRQDAACRADKLPG